MTQPTTSPVDLGFLSRIVGVSWADNDVWLLLGNDGGKVSLPGIEYDFVSEAGGTPGLIIPRAVSGSPGHPYDFFSDANNMIGPVPASLLTVKAKMLAGRPIIGQIGFWNAFGGVGLLIGMSNFPDTFFIRYTNPGEGSGGGIAFMKKGVVKAGRIDISQNLPGVNFDGIGVGNVLADKKAMTVVPVT